MAGGRRCNTPPRRHSPRRLRRAGLRIGAALSFEKMRLE
jgi:hypothetical protein